MNHRKHALIDVLAAISGFVVVVSALRFLSVPGAGAVTVVLMTAVVTWLMHRRGIGWTDIGLVRPKSLWRAALWVVGIYLTTAIVVGLGVNPLANYLGLAKLDTSAFASIKGNLNIYLIYLIPISWGAAAFGEEMLFRGFLSRRFLTLFGDTGSAIFLAVILQAVLFGLGHIYLGARGVITAMTVGLIMGMYYFLNKRNLWPLIISHGLIDSIGMTVLYLGYELP